MKKALKIQLLGIRLAFASRMAYRADFFISSAIMLAGDMIIPLITFLIYSSGVSFPGWSLYEVLLIQGVFMVSRGIAFSLFFGLVWDTLSTVREGTFDLVLLKPHPAMHIAIARSFDCDSLGTLFGGIVISGIALTNLPPVSPAGWVAFFLLLFLSLMVLLSFAVIMAATVFKWVGNTRVNEIFESLTLFGQYPVSIFSKSFAGLLTWILPISMIAYIPASTLLGRPVSNLVPAIVASVIFFILGLAFWHLMKKSYTSAGG
jgi:ABC-2 type transport system permease protein